ncbi:hypothetical protein FQA39_LY09368 [Lamprigera yunnana]|nr:hypothetical protein FQA39_LY09368 [Lamprigera yunnana]
MFRNNSSNSVLTNLSLDSISDDELEPWHGLIQKLTIFHLDLLNAIFKKGKCKDNLNKAEFISAIEEILGNCRYSVQASILFCQIDKEEKDQIKWEQFLDFIINDYNSEVKPSIHLNVFTIFNPPHVKRDTIVKIVLIETEKYFCYAIVSKYGHVGLYDGKMNFLTSYQMVMTREDLVRKEDERRRRNRWVMDAIFVKDILMLIITTSTRSIAFYDASGLTHVPMWLILGVPSIIQCFSYNFGALFMGDEKGQLFSLNFLQPNNGLFRKKHNNKLSVFYWIVNVKELYNEKDFVVIKHLGQLHKENIAKMHICSTKSIITTCSIDPNSSVIIKPFKNKMKTYEFKIYKGVTCFAISSLLKVLITGNSSGLISIWNIVVTTEPIGVLNDHKNEIVDIQIMERQQWFLSCSKDALLKLWSIKEQKCLYSLRVQFPSFQVLGKTIEWGVNCMYPGPKRYNNMSNSEIEDAWQRSHFFLSCCNHVAQINLCLPNGYNSDITVLPPPPLQNSVLIPTHWKICGNSMEVKDNDIEIKGHFPASSEEIDDDKVTQHIESLKFILEKDILGENNLHTDINLRLACLEIEKQKMQTMVSECAPYLVLDLPVIGKIELNPNLPIPKSKKMRELINKTQQALSDVAVKSQMAMELSSSTKTLSSRSSIITFD